MLEQDSPLSEGEGLGEGEWPIGEDLSSGEGGCWPSDDDGSGGEDRLIVSGEG